MQTKEAFQEKSEMSYSQEKKSNHYNYELLEVLRKSTPSTEKLNFYHHVIYCMRETGNKKILMKPSKLSKTEVESFCHLNSTYKT